MLCSQASSYALTDSSDTTRQAEAEAESEAEPAADRDADGTIQRLTTAEPGPSTGNAHSAGIFLEQELSPGALTCEEECIQPTNAADQSKDGQEATAQGGFSSSGCEEHTWYLETDELDAESDADYFSMPLPWAESQAAALDAEPLAADGVQESDLPVTMRPAAATGQVQATTGQHAATDQTAATAAEAVLQLADLKCGSISREDLLAAEQGQQSRRDLGDAASLPAIPPAVTRSVPDVGTAMANREALLQPSCFQFGSISRGDLVAAEQRQVSNMQFGSIITEDLMIAEQRRYGNRGLGGAVLPPVATLGVSRRSAADVGTVVANPEALPQLGDVRFGSISQADLVAAEQRQDGNMQFGSITSEDLVLAEQRQHGNRDLGGAILPPAAAPPVLIAVQASPGVDVGTAVASADTAVVNSLPIAVGAEVTATALAASSMPAVGPPASDLSSSIKAAARVTDTQAAAASSGSVNDQVSEIREEGQVEEEGQGEYDKEEASGHDDGGVERMGMGQHDAGSDGAETVVDTSIDYAAFLTSSLLGRMEGEAGGRGDQIKALSKHRLYRLTCVTLISACLTAC